MKATLLNSLFLIASCSAGIMYMPKGAIEDNRLFLAESSNHQYSPQVTDNLEYIDEKPTTHPEIDHGSNKEYSGPKDANNGKHPYLHVGEETHPESNKKSESVISHMKEKNDSEKTNGDYHKTKEHNGAHSVEETDYVESTQKHGTKHMDKYTNNSKGNKVHHSEYQHPEKPTSKDDYDNAKTEKSQHVPNIDQESKPDHSKEESHTFNEMVGATEEPDYNEKVYKYGDQYVDKPSHGSRNSHYVVREYKQKDNHGDDGAISSYNNEKSGARASPKIGNGKDYEQQNSHRNSDNDHKPKINAKDGSKIKDHNQPKDTSIRYNDGPDSAIKKDDYSHENNDKSEVAPEHKRKPLDGKKPTGDDHGATNKPKDIYKKETHEKAKDKKISNSDKLDDSHNYSGMKKTPKDNGKASESYKPSKHAVSLDRQSPANKNPFAEKNSHNTDTKDTPKKIHKPAANNEYKNENAPSDKIKPKEQSGYSSQNDHKSASDRKTDNKNKSTGNDNYKGKEKPKNFHDSGKKSTNKEIGNKDKSAKKDHTYGNNDQSAAEGKKAHDKSKGNTGKSVDNYKSNGVSPANHRNNPKGGSHYNVEQKQGLKNGHQVKLQDKEAYDGGDVKKFHDSKKYKESEEKEEGDQKSLDGDSYTDTASDNNYEKDDNEDADEDSDKDEEDSGEYEDSDENDNEDSDEDKDDAENESKEDEDDTGDSDDDEKSDTDEE